MIHFAEPEQHSTTIDEAKMQAMEQWRPPAPAVGQTVLFYPQSNKSNDPNRSPGLATVWKVGLRSVELRDGHGNWFPGVSHISDPKLDHFQHLRQSGAWDFTDFDKNLEQLRGLPEEVRKLREEVSSLKAKANK